MERAILIGFVTLAAIWAGMNLAGPVAHALAPVANAIHLSAQGDTPTKGEGAR